MWRKLTMNAVIALETGPRPVNTMSMARNSIEPA